MLHVALCATCGSHHQGGGLLFSRADQMGLFLLYLLHQRMDSHKRAMLHDQMVISLVTVLVSLIPLVVSPMLSEEMIIEMKMVSLALLPEN